MSEPGERGDQPAAEHWGLVGPDLLYDEVRYPAYARALHAAGHSWGLWRLWEPLGPAGLALGLPRRLAAETAADVEATAVLVESVGVEYARALWRVADFGLTLGDVDWDSLRDNVGMIWREARARGCRVTGRAVRLLGDEGWLHEASWHVLREWDEIAALADLLGRGRVLEGDEVAGVLRWW